MVYFYCLDFSKLFPGKEDSVAVAAINITTTVTNFFMIVCYAMGKFFQLLLDNNLVQVEIERAKDYDLKMVFMNFIMCFTVSCCFI